MKFPNFIQENWRLILKNSPNFGFGVIAGGNISEKALIKWFFIILLLCIFAAHVTRQRTDNSYQALYEGKPNKKLVLYYQYFTVVNHFSSWHYL
jgi:hypothetical protein